MHLSVRVIGRNEGRAGSQASQDFDPDARTAVNKAEVLGSRLFVTASGMYSPAVSSPAEVCRCPAPNEFQHCFPIFTRSPCKQNKVKRAKREPES